MGFDVSLNTVLSLYVGGPLPACGLRGRIGLYEGASHSSSWMAGGQGMACLGVNPTSPQDRFFLQRGKAPNLLDSSFLKPQLMMTLKSGRVVESLPNVQIEQRGKKSPYLLTVLPLNVLFFVR